jgi:hypothetical protein
MATPEQDIAGKIAEAFAEKTLLTVKQSTGLAKKISKESMTASDWRMLAEMSIQEEEKNAAQTPNS